MEKGRRRLVRTRRQRLQYHCRLLQQLLGDRQTGKHCESSTLLKKPKAHFALYGSPRVVVSDNGPQFTSANFENFSSSFDFEHRTSSSYNSQSNGKAESAAKTAKALLRKNKEGDQSLALLNDRNTPSQATRTSPAQRFLNWITRTLLPSTEKKS